MNRTDFQELAKVRLEESKTLLDQKKYDGAYYLAGYAVECGLKACIAKLTKLDDFPPKKEFVGKCFSHNFNNLLEVSGLLPVWNLDKDSNPKFLANCQIVNAWSEESRYGRKGQVVAQELFDAITDPEHGVMQWIEQRW